MNEIKLIKYLNEWFVFSVTSFVLVIACVLIIINSPTTSRINDYVLIFVSASIGLSPAIFSVGTIMYGVIGCSRRIIKVASVHTIKCLIASLIVFLYAFIIVVKVNSVEPEITPERKRLSIEELEQETTGTVQYMEFEGGFWGIVGDNGGGYDVSNLPMEFKVDGLKVRFKAKVMPDVGSFHMWGSIVRIERIEKLK